MIFDKDSVLFHVQIIIALIMGKKFADLKLFPGKGAHSPYARQIFLGNGV